MITADFVFDLILGIVERFEDENDFCIHRYLSEKVEDEEIDFVLDNEIETALNCLNIENRVSAVCTYGDVYAICVSFVINGELHQRIIAAEEC